MKILVACEESQEVCRRFRDKGHEAYSCDVMDCSGGHNEWHIKNDVLPLLDGNCIFKTVDGIEHHIIGKWDMIIAFPPCTHLAVSGARHFETKRKDGRHKFYIVDAKTAEMAKFMENAWLATKVSFCCDFFRACEKAGVHYEVLRELFTPDPRVNPSHTFVYENSPYFDSHCLNKDVPSIANQYDMDLLKSVLAINEKYKSKY